MADLSWEQFMRGNPGLGWDPLTNAPISKAPFADWAGWQQQRNRRYGADFLAANPNFFKDPQTGQWMSKTPAGDWAGLHRYLSGAGTGPVPGFGPKPATPQEPTTPPWKLWETWELPWMKKPIEDVTKGAAESYKALSTQLPETISEYQKKLKEMRDQSVAERDTGPLSEIMRREDTEYEKAGRDYNQSLIDVNKRNEALYNDLIARQRAITEERLTNLGGQLNEGIAAATARIKGLEIGQGARTGGAPTASGGMASRYMVATNAPRLAYLQGVAAAKERDIGFEQGAARELFGNERTQLGIMNALDQQFRGNTQGTETFLYNLNNAKNKMNEEEFTNYVNEVFRTMNMPMQAVQTYAQALAAAEALQRGAANYSYTMKYPGTGVGPVPYYVPQTPREYTPSQPGGGGGGGGRGEGRSDQVWTGGVEGGYDQWARNSRAIRERGGGGVQYYDAAGRPVSVNSAGRPISSGPVYTRPPAGGWYQPGGTYVPRSYYYGNKGILYDEWPEASRQDFWAGVNAPQQDMSDSYSEWTDLNRQTDMSGWRAPSYVPPAPNMQSWSGYIGSPTYRDYLAEQGNLGL